MQSLPCSTDYCEGKTAAMLLKILVPMDAYWQPVCSQHGNQPQNVALQIKSIQTREAVLGLGLVPFPSAQ